MYDTINDDNVICGFAALVSGHQIQSTFSAQLPSAVIAHVGSVPPIRAIGVEVICAGLF
jgi:hypothetical protein